MKKLLFGVLAVLAAATLLTGCENEKPAEPVNEEPAAVTPVEEPVEEIVEEPQEGVGNTDEGMVVLQLEDYLMKAFSGEIEEVKFNNIKVYTEEEISGDDAIKSHNINEGDIVFDVNYDLKIAEGVEDMMKFTAANGEIDGQWVKDKSNIGILRSGADGNYTVDAFGTGW